MRQWLTVAGHRETSGGYSCDKPAGEPRCHNGGRSRSAGITCHYNASTSVVYGLGPSKNIRRRRDRHLSVKTRGIE